MTLKEKAYKYAIDALSNQIKALEDAYLAGYSEAKGVHIIDNVEYIDLGLPSGTLWSSKRSVDEYTLGEALSFNLPTIEQIEELERNCRKWKKGNHIHVLGPNGNEIIFEEMKDNQSMFDYWCQPEDKDGEKNCFRFCNNRGTYTLFLYKNFPGYRYPIFLTKQH